MTHVPNDISSPRIGASAQSDCLFAWKSSNLQIEIYNGRLGAPAGLLDFRKRIYVDECQIMLEENLNSANDNLGIHIVAKDLTTGEIIGVSHMVEAELSDFSKSSGIPRDLLKNSIYGSRSALAPDKRGSSIYPLLVYAAASYYRSLGRKYIVAYIEAGDHSVHRRFNSYAIPNAKNLHINLKEGKHITLEPKWSTIDKVQSVNFESFRSEEAKDIARQIAVTEIEITVAQWARNCNASAAFWKRAKNNSLTKHQYISFLGQLHRFVRNTTRVIALAWNKAQTKDLQKHFRKHVNEELDHEMIIEADLKSLNADVDYIVKKMPSEPGTRAFNALQESLLGYHSDPIMYMAVPFAVEGISAFIETENMEALARQIMAWGIDDPRQVTRFLASHRDFDGEDGGHWDGTLMMLRKYIQSETQAQEFLAISRSVFDNFLSMVEGVSSLDEPDHWLATEEVTAEEAFDDMRLPATERISSMTL